MATSITKNTQDNSLQVKSRERVASHGEVFTAEREVKAMCDLVKDECARIESRFLEPACGNGNFLSEVLARKLETCARIYGKSKADFEQYSFLAVTSIYGVELLADNVAECRVRLLGQYKEFYEKTAKSPLRTDLASAVQFVLEKNILCGNALSLKKVDENQNDTDEPIVFAEWSFVKGAMVKRRDFRLDVLLAKEDVQKTSFDLFDDSPLGQDYWMPDPETKELIPKPIKEYPIVHFLEVAVVEPRTAVARPDTAVARPVETTLPNKACHSPSEESPHARDVSLTLNMTGESLPQYDGNGGEK